MIRNIVHDPILLARRSAPATAEDAQVGQDLIDTLRANRERCVGMAANMIGVLKRVIVFEEDGKEVLMYNPEILSRADRYEAQEGCLSLSGVRTAQRWRSIRVSYLNERFLPRKKRFTGWTAQIIQHEIDHCNGVLI